MYPDPPFVIDLVDELGTIKLKVIWVVVFVIAILGQLVKHLDYLTLILFYFFPCKCTKVFYFVLLGVGRDQGKEMCLMEFCFVLLGAGRVI